MCLGEICSHAQNLPTIIGRIVNIIEGTYMIIQEDWESLHFDDEQAVHVSSKSYEENGYGYNLGCQAYQRHIW